MLKELKNLTVQYCNECGKFTFQMNDEEKNIVKAAYNKMLNEVHLGGLYHAAVDVVVIDEIAYNAMLINKKEVCNLVSDCPKNIKLILTERSLASIF